MQSQLISPEYTHTHTPSTHTHTHRRCCQPNQGCYAYLIRLRDKRALRHLSSFDLLCLLLAAFRIQSPVGMLSLHKHRHLTTGRCMGERDGCVYLQRPSLDGFGSRVDHRVQRQLGKLTFILLATQCSLLGLLIFTTNQTKEKAVTLDSL